MPHFHILPSLWARATVCLFSLPETEGRPPLPSNPPAWLPPSCTVKEQHSVIQFFKITLYGLEICWNKVVFATVPCLCVCFCQCYCDLHSATKENLLWQSNARWHVLCLVWWIWRMFLFVWTSQRRLSVPFDFIRCAFGQFQSSL